MGERKGLITMMGAPMTLSGHEVKVGDMAPDVELMDQNLKPVKLSAFKGKPLLLLTVPSLDTSVCSLEGGRFNKEVNQFGDQITTILVSKDLPFAQKRWCGAEKAGNIKTFSDYRKNEMGEKYGLYIQEIGLLARAVFVIDHQFKIHYVHLVNEVAKEPPYEEVLNQVKDLLSKF